MTAAPTDTPASLRRLAHATAAWVVARIAVAAAWALTSTGWFGRREVATSMRDEGLFLWDGTYYRELARHGYAALDPEVQRFFPAYHLAGRAVGATGIGSDVGLLVVSNAAALVSGWLVATLVAEVTGDERLAARSAWWTALFPAAGLLAAAYGEPLAIAVGAGALLAAHRRSWGTAAILGATAGLTRPTGLLIAIPLAFAVWPTIRGALPGSRSGARPAGGSGRGTPAAAVAAVVSPAAGAAAYFAWLWVRFDSWDEPLEAQRGFRAGWHEPLSRLVRAVVDVAGGSFRDGYNLAFAAIAIAALGASWRRLPIGWSAYVGATLLVTLAANNINSLGRYVGAAFPLAAMIPVLVGRVAGERRWVEHLALAASTVALVGYLLAAWSGRMIP